MYTAHYHRPEAISGETLNPASSDASKIVTLANTARNPENKRKLQHQRFTCRLCGQPVHAICGPIKVWHFRHERGTECHWETWSEHESLEHLGLKRATSLAVQKLFPGCSVTFEHIVPEAKRIADLLVVTKDGDEIAVECQLASITQEELELRTESYERQNYEVIWVFRKDRVENPRAPLFKGFYDWLFERGNYVMLAEPQYSVVEQKLGVFDAQDAP
ncbi:MAG: hypothetical protein HC933_07250 [Pleurocapsa sp. SU_196_0]|nr:hypothetical protein [Pleurocapsa sp. SU_196_0]